MTTEKKTFNSTSNICRPEYDFNIFTFWCWIKKKPPWVSTKSIHYLFRICL